ncbi:laminin subunit gamma-1-like isoform X1 [Limulus polyphemus]|uniref:Laminin subunit gamma-1-like isoform X1 n=1 Tax=Limulus polyphemus TaxID=6850 RepID=A0ABM1BE32_LIMPO|nr:laminin subunit gamma-1-like isoform X1 [Limulus polyphemus]
MAERSRVANSAFLLRSHSRKDSFTWIVLLFLVNLIPAQNIEEIDFSSQRGTPSRCYDDEGRPQQCVPEFSNAAFDVRVEATNTCGMRGPTEYCLQTSATGAKKACEICDNSYPQLAHPPDYLTDLNNNNNETWWQSETMFERIQYPTQVNLTLHLGKAFDITYVRLKFHTSRPESFAIYKRTSEDTPWIPYQYYSATCRETYNLPDSSYVSRDDETRALCTSEFSDISPLTGGNVAFSTLEGRPSAYYFENSPILQEWVTATSIRISLNRINTFGDEIFGDPKVLKSYYYAISDFAVGGKCKCNGHATECVVTGERLEEQRLVCRCHHNTTGPDCNECLPFYNDLPWARATAANANECQPCNCNGRSNKCYFDKQLYERTGHGGHCIECTDNTDGPHCERCKENFYERDDGRCVPCNCDSTGSRSLQCNRQGHCQCKPGVDGEKCERCASNYYDFSSQGCRPCGCNLAGSVNNEPTCDPVTGICQCKENVEGQHCDRCKPGFFSLQEVNEFGCLTCFCYGHSSVCRSAPGYSKISIESSFTRGKENWKAQLHSGEEVGFQYNAIIQNIGVESSGIDSVYFSAPGRYLGDQKSSYNQFLHFTLRIGDNVPQATVEDIILEGSGLTISQPIFGQGNPLPNVKNQEYRFLLNEHSIYGWNPRIGALDFISILSNLTAIKIKGTYSADGAGFLDNVQLDSAHRSPVGFEATWIEMCTCPDGYVGQFCESCGPGFRHDPPGGGKFARCVPCNCNGHAQYCDSESGRCICEHHTAGDNCEHCATGYYGNALQGTHDDCQPCPCPNNGACVILLDEEVACLQCPTGYAGHKCDLCVDGYFGDPNGHYGGSRPCESCECNENIDLNAVGNCNKTTGECLKCIYNTGGPHCETCLPGYYGDALAVPKGDCKACNCYPPGTLLEAVDNGILTCDLGSGRCHCKPHVTGRQCDLCDDGYWNLDSGNGCELCNCDPIGAFNRTCNVRTGQCFCRPGITGKRCESCLPNYYGYSLDGCIPCECDPVGSTSPQCDSSGQCKCKPNVEGRRCDRCKENKYNKEAGCIDCPPCYNLVQDAVNEHRDKLDELARLLDEIRENPQVVDDVDFEKKLEEVMRRVDELLDDARRASGGDGNLLGQLHELRKRIEDVQKTAGKVADKIDDAGDISEEGRRNITLAEEAIKRAQDALANARQLLETEGLDALEKAKERSDKFGQQSHRMSEIAREARHRADQHQEEAVEIEKLAEEALNTSTEAYQLAKDTLNTQDETRDEIRKLRNKLDDTADLLQRTRDIARESQDEADKAYDDALDIYTDASSVTIPNIDVPKMKDQAQEIIEEARKIRGNADGLIEDNQQLVDKIEDQKEEAEDLLAEGIRQQQIADEMLADADAALAKAKEAVASGDRTLEEANKTLDTLKKFDKLVKDSKDEADDALEKAPEIEKLIEEAEGKTKDAEDALSGAGQNAVFARDIAQEAQRIAEQASDDADGIRKDADETKDKAGQLRDQANDLAGEVADTAARMKDYENQAEKDEGLAEEALKRANQAKTSATDASKKVKGALDAVDRIMDALDDLDDIDLDLLKELEKRLAEAEDELKDPKLDKQMNELRKARNDQHRWMRDYEKEIEQLKKDVKNVKEIKDALPEECYKRVVLEP